MFFRGVRAAWQPGSGFGFSNWGRCDCFDCCRKLQISSVSLRFFFLFLEDAEFQIPTAASATKHWETGD
jgi:hypothetical protein